MDKKRTATMTAKYMWHPVVETERELADLPSYWGEQTMNSFGVQRASLYEQFEMFANNLGVEIILVRTTPSYMKAMIGNAPYDQMSTAKFAEILGKSPGFDTNHVYS